MNINLCSVCVREQFTNMLISLTKNTNMVLFVFVRFVYNPTSNLTEPIFFFFLKLQLH
ncbi:hypothetical protein HanRHA438_Chr13g0594341 [Helianthus annuus]|nr:hypothetical protein HanRHA438_Chr13g0594341 [Helianthus annuus]